MNPFSDYYLILCTIISVCKMVLNISFSVHVLVYNKTLSIIGQIVVNDFLKLMHYITNTGMCSYKLAYSTF